MKIWNFFKNNLTNVKAIPITEINGFNEKVLSTNLFRERISAYIIIIYVFCNLFVDVFFYRLKWDSMPGYKTLFYIHLGSIALYLGILFVQHMNDKKKLNLNKAIHYLYIIIGFIMNETLSINAQFTNGQILTYIIALTGISVLLLLNNVEIIVAMTVSFLTFTIGILFTQDDTLIVTSIINNVLAAIICSFLFSRLNYSSYINEFLAQKGLEASLKKSTELNNNLRNTLEELHGKNAYISKLLEKQEDTNTTLKEMIDVKDEQARIIQLQHAKLQNIVESTDDFIWSVDRDFKIITYNTAIKNYLRDSYGVDWEKGDSTDIIPTDYTSVWSDLYELAAKEGNYQIDLKTEAGDRIIAYSLNSVYINSEITEITIFGKDITARIDKEREIIRMNLLLERSVNERTKELKDTINELQHFSLVVAHELKTPIKEIEYYLYNKQNNDLSSERILQICTDMSAMIERLFYYAASSKHDLHKETIDMRKMIIKLYTNLKKSYQNNSILNFDTGLPKVTADQVLMQQVVTNILSNALKFSAKRQRSEITVGCWEKNEEYIYYIKDNGVGFGMEFSGKLFGIFERLHTKEEFEGSGIGLATIRNIILRHGGRTWIESELDRGTTIYFSLPHYD